MLRRSSPLLVLGMIAVVASCDNLSGLSGAGTPVSVVLMNARTRGTGYTTYPKVNFYMVASAQFSFSTIVSDTCIVGPYDSTTAAVNNATVIGAGKFLVAAVSGDTDSLYKATTSDGTYHPTNTVGIPFTPGDSVWFNVGGDNAGFPAIQASSRTAEPYTIIRPSIPPSGQSMIVQWTPATDNNAAMYLSLLYATGGSTSLNAQVFCDFHDDGQGTVQAYLLPALASSSIPFVLKAQRVRTNLLLSSTAPTGYMNIISTFDFPTPVSP
jgi:hypothetical protein